MKVLHITNSLGMGGAEKLLEEAIPLYNNLGIPTDILLFDGTEFPFFKSLKKTNPENVFVLNANSVYNPLNVLKIIPYLKKYDIIHVHLFPALYWVAFAKIISFYKGKLVYTEHSTNNKRRKSSLFRILDKFIYKKYNKIIAITDEVKDALISHLNLKDITKITVIFNGVNLSKIINAKTLNKKEFFNDDDSVIVLQVARFYEPKDHATLIKAIASLPNRFKLLLVGEGVLKNKNEILVNELQINDRVLFLGARMDIPSLLKTADIVVLSSKYEGLSLSCVEGMASGRPFIASNAPGLGAVVKDAGVLFPVGDEKFLASTILELESNPSYYQHVAESGRRKASEYDIEVMVNKIIHLYKVLSNE
jgi:glycosyltransferase involved in cell wall biosynthesis